jgi:hypothetical protein
VKTIPNAFCKLGALILLSTSVLLGQSKVGGSGDRPVSGTGRNCNYNSKCGSRVSMKATIPLDSNVAADGITYLTTAGGPGGDVPLRAVGVGSDSGWSRMDTAIPIIDFKNGTVTYEAAFYNRSSNRNRVAAITVTYTQPKTGKAYVTSSGYVLVPAAGRQCTSNACATAKTLQAFVPQNATVTKIRYFTSAANGPNDDDTPLHEVQSGEIAWSSVEPAVPKTYPNIPNTVSYETVFYNRSHDRTREAAILVEYTMP